MNTKPAISNLKVTNKIGPKSTAEILINIKALPQIAAKAISKIQSLNSIIKLRVKKFVNFKLIEKV